MIDEKGTNDTEFASSIISNHNFVTSSDGRTDAPHQRLGFKKGMAIASLNVNGIRVHFDEINFLLIQLRIDILALNEIKIDPLYPTVLICIPGYEQARLERSSHGGGVAIYIKDM